MKTFETHNNLIDVINKSKKDYISMGRLLSNLKSSYTEAVGEGINTWQDYLRQPEIGLTVGEANKLIDIYKHLIVRLGFAEEMVAEIPKKNLTPLLDVIRNIETMDDAEEIVADATFLSQKDFKEKIYENKNSAEQTYTYSVYKRSNQTKNMSKVHGITHEEIKEKFNL